LEKRIPEAKTWKFLSRDKIHIFPIKNTLTLLESNGRNKLNQGLLQASVLAHFHWQKDAENKAII